MLSRVGKAYWKLKLESHRFAFVMIPPVALRIVGEISPLGSKPLNECLAGSNHLTRIVLHFAHGMHMKLTVALCFLISCAFLAATRLTRVQRGCCSDCYDSKLNDPLPINLR